MRRVRLGLGYRYRGCYVFYWRIDLFFGIVERWGWRGGVEVYFWFLAYV